MSKNKWTKKELNEFKNYILDKRKKAADEMDQVKQRAEDMLKNDSTNAIYSSHMADAGSDLVEMEKAYYFVQRENNFLKYLNRALDMIDEGTFGICIKCEALIKKERLMEVPHTRSCFACKSKR